MNSDSKDGSKNSSESVTGKELNSWRRGFTPQAEIWNGRMAAIGLLLFLIILIGSNSLFPN